MISSEQAHSTEQRSGVLLVNLGTPDAPETGAIRRYLKQFLSDPRVVELPRFLWLPILYGFILPFRPSKLVSAYAKVWSDQGSPLLAISRLQQAGLSRALGSDVDVELAMTYGKPSINDAMERMTQRGVRRILVLPLYPQYSATTTAASFDAIFANLRWRRWLPEIRTITSYHDDKGYIEALAQSVESSWSTHGRAEHLLISFHSIPRKYLELGDPYYCQCQKTARLLTERLQLESSAWSISFQSRLGRQPWLQPYTDVVIPQLAQHGHRKLDVICPGFSADCLETLEEVAIRYGEQFVAAGGDHLHYIPALNDQAAHLAALSALIQRHLSGWQQSPSQADDDRQDRLARVEKIKPSLYSEVLLERAK